MMLFGHGLPKLLAFSEKVQTFPDPLGLGSQMSLILAIFAEVFCAAAVMFGVMTRYAAIPLVVTMLVAAALVHGDDPWQKKEAALCFLFPFVCLIIAGGGKFALDGLRRQST